MAVIVPVNGDGISIVEQRAPAKNGDVDLPL
jgi:hypothetical protein